MYQPKRYKKDDPTFQFNFINENPFATVVLQGNHLLATHIPILVKGQADSFELFGHIANHNPMFPFLKNGTPVLVIFNGPHTYVSSSWYEDPDISTWDYSAVHIRAQLRLQNKDELTLSLEKLIRRFEKDQQNPLYKEDIPTSIWEENLPGITGFWLKPIEVTGVSKWHQHFSEKDKANIVEGLNSTSACPHISEHFKKKSHDL